MPNDRAYKAKHTGSAQTSWNGFTSPEWIKRAKEYAKHSALQQLVDYIGIDKPYRMIINTATEEVIFSMPETLYTVTITIWEL